MGVCHFMGLGKSPGAVVSAITYLAEPYERWEQCGKEFFSTSGSSSETAEDSKRGDIESLVLFATPEVRKGELHCEDYIDNQGGRESGDKKRSEAMGKVLQSVLPAELKRIAGDRKQIPVYWCDIDHADMWVTFERIARAMYAAKQPGDNGLEMWVNLTGGSNVVNLALQLASSLLSHASRLYYLSSSNPQCLRHTIPNDDIGDEKRDRFWVNVPAIYLELDPIQKAILATLEDEKTLADDELLSRLRNRLTDWEQINRVDLNSLRRDYLNRMAGQGFIAQVSVEDKHLNTVGDQWEFLKPYYDVVANFYTPTDDVARTLKDLARHHCDWCFEEMYQLN